MSMFFELNNDGAMSIKKFETMLKSNAIRFFDSEEFEQIIEHYLELGKMKMARKAIQLGLSQHPTSIEIRLLKAEILIFDNELKKAQHLLDELYKLHPNHSEIYIQKANIFSKTDQHLKAIELLKQALDLTPDQADVYNLIGMEYLFIEDYNKAKYHFIKCIELDHNDYATLFNIIYCFEFLEQHEQAIQFLTQYIDVNPYCEVAWHQLGKQYYNLEQYDKALEAFDYAIISDELFIGAYIEKAKVLEIQERYQEAIANYQITIKLDDPTSFAYYRLGVNHEKLGNNDKAIKYYLKSVNEDPLNEKAWLAIIDYYAMQKDYQKAMKHVNKALEMDGDNPYYWTKYAKLSYQLKYYEESEYGFRKAIELGDTSLDVWIQRAAILMLLGENESLISNLEYALEFYPNEPALEYRLAGAYFINGSKLKGRFHLQNAFKNDPHYVSVFKNLFPSISKITDVTSIIN